MFGKIFKEELIKILKINNRNGDPNIVQKINLIKEMINQNYCRFNNKFYKQTMGLAMGSPLSPNIYLWTILKIKIIINNKVSEGNNANHY